MASIYVLQIGKEDFSKSYFLPDYVKYTYLDMFTSLPRSSYDVVLIDRMISMQEAELLLEVTRAYTLFVTERVELSGRLQWLFVRLAGQMISMEQLPAFLSEELANFYQQSSGGRFNVHELAIGQTFKGEISWQGNHNVTLSGNFGEEMKQVAYWREHIFLLPDQKMDLWLEYKKSPGVAISLEVTQFVPGSLSRIQKEWKFGEQDLAGIVTLDGDKGPAFVSLCAAGEGELKITTLHYRRSRGKHGHILPGGKRYVTSDREEIFAYFEPGNAKPPLNVYFSGYNTKELFEGYQLMKELDCPFLLLSDNRLDGGGFYLGSREYEKTIIDIIREHMIALDFSPRQTIFSGVSMGACGAMYYGCYMKPHAFVLGTPLLSLGEVATLEKRKRPGKFPESLDVLMHLEQDTRETACLDLNERMWKRFRETDFLRTKIIVGYMIEDDFDGTAYDKILSNLKSDVAQVYGKGFHGRHKDNPQAVVIWLMEQHRRMLNEDFERGMM